MSVTQHRGRYSASQIATFRDCARKWAWDKIESVPRPSNRYAERGTAIHALLEAWLKDGTPFDVSTDYGRIAAAGLPHLPPPGVASVEGGFSLALASADFTGYIDARWVEPDGLPIVLDHKTTSNLAYAKTPEDLAHDPQAMLYAAVAMRDAHAVAAELRWVYYEATARPRARKVSLRVLREHVTAELDVIDETAREMNHVYQSGARALDLAPTVGACDAYGGCPYVSHCNLSGQEKMRAYMTGQSWAEKMKARKEAQSAVETTATAAPFINPPEAPAIQLAEPAPIAAEAAPEPTPTLFEVNAPRPVAKKFGAKAATETNSKPEVLTGDVSGPAPTVDANIGASILAEMDRRIVQTPALLDTFAIQIFAATIIRGEHFDDEIERGRVAYSRAAALLKARP